MFLIRQAMPADVDDLHALAKQTFFINLPPDREIIAHKIDQSVRSFARLAASSGPKPRPVAGGMRGSPSSKSSFPASRPAAKPHPEAHGRGAHSSTSGLRAITGQSDLFLVVLENLDTKGVIGTSQVVARMGGPASPRHFMTLEQASNSSRSLGIGWTHLVGRMGSDPSGPSEIGGLILNQAFRGHPLRLGRFLSFVRFHLIGLHRKAFADTIVAEMLGPITRTGYNPFYEKFTRHFITRPFNDVYRFSQTSREFLDTLMPHGDMFLSILDPEVANAAGEVSDDTRPARAILERLGFSYHNRIDPLDGGPHLEARTSDIQLVKATRKIAGFTPIARPKGRPAARSRRSSEPAATLIASTLNRNGYFRAVQAEGDITGQRASVDERLLDLIEQSNVVSRGATPLLD